MTQEELKDKIGSRLANFALQGQEHTMLLNALLSLINSHVKEVIGEDCHEEHIHSYNELRCDARNDLREDQRLRAGLSEKGSK
jgi:type IV secretory pathway ATPase VirB11/archaellum biosynthesis ATPase